VTDGVELLRQFNRHDGVAHTMAAEVAERPTAEAADLSPSAAAERFRAGAARLRDADVSAQIAVRYPVVGSTTTAVIVRVALMEATVHLLDLARGGGRRHSVPVGADGHSGPAGGDPGSDSVGRSVDRPHRSHGYPSRGPLTPAAQGPE
jgi:hypothetical protein